MYKYYFFLFLVLAQLFVIACKTPVVSNSKPNTVVAEDTIPVKFTPDPFSSLLELETRFGVMKIELYFETSKHRENFLKLANENYYDDLLFHRVIKNFMVQGGDPSSRNANPTQVLGNGGPGYEIDAEINSKYCHLKGALAAARSSDEVNPDRKSSGSQFYIVHGGPVSDEQLDKNERSENIIYSPEQRQLYKTLGGAAQLDMKYTVFGRVYEGLDIIDSIAYQMTGNYDRPQQDVKMKLKVVRE